MDATSKCRDASSIGAMRGSVECEPPNEKLYQFKGRLFFFQDNLRQIFPLNHNQLLHRGAQLRNTQWAYGIVVYAGVDTKLFLNQQPPPSKFSTVERMLNKFILAIFLAQMFICLLNAVLSGFFEDTEAKDMFYLGVNQYSTPVYGLRNFFTYFVLFNTMIPISLWVTLELVKVGQAKFMEWDEQMALNKDDITSTGAKAKTSNLNEELGRVSEYFEYMH